ncbi:MAG: HAMP domain-containing protein [Elusimicrobia bacterium]|nr:HAMP domain-containing protein [Elusimicrobiota bacterium]
MPREQPSAVSAPWSPPPHGPIKRRIIFIKWSLQARYVAVVFVSLLVAGFIVAWDLYYTFGRLILNEATATAIYPVFQQMHKLMVLKFAIFVVITVVIACFISHKFAGPLYRFERVAEQVGQGDLTVRVHLRKGDELTETAGHLNQMIIALQEKVLRDRRLAEQLSGKLTGISRSLQSDQLTPPEAAKVLETLSHEITSLTSEFYI